MKELVKNSNMRLMVFSSAKELGDLLDNHLVRMHNLDPDKYTFQIKFKELFFEDGHQKIEIDETVRNKNLFLLTDIGNYSIEYNMHGFINHASPNDLYTQLKDGIGA